MKIRFTEKNVIYQWKMLHKEKTDLSLFFLYAMITNAIYITINDFRRTFMKKIISLFSLLLVVFALTACGNKNNIDNNGNGTTDKVTSSGSYELALVTDVGNIDDRSFNQGTWEGLKKYNKL